MSYRWTVSAAVIAALAFGGAPAAQADTYAPGAQSQDFVTDGGGWTATVANEGLCIPLLTCPQVANTYVPSGGADGNGYVRSVFATLLDTLLATVRSTWSSPAFTYTGAGGKAATALTLDLNVRPALGSLLELGNSSAYQVDVVDTATGATVAGVPSTRLTSSTAWSPAPTTSIDPAALQLGASYRIRITTTLRTTVLGVAADGEVGYDNVRLTASGPGGSGGSANGGSGVTSQDQLQALATSAVLPGSARLVGNTVRLRLTCPKQADPQKCVVKARGLAAGKSSKAATSVGKAKLKAGAKRTVRVTVKPAYAATYRQAAKVFVKEKLKVGSVVVTVRKRVSLKR